MTGVAALSLFAALAAPASPLVYPLDAPPNITAVFGSFRIGHHHAGLDLYTDERTVKVLAAADGVLYRMQRNHSGYGRGLYLRHPDGRVTVYGHLAAFSPKIEAIARKLKRGPDGYVFKSNLKPVPIAAGEHLGWVGTSGTDLIHLHFELRDRSGPINPLRNGLPVPDTKPPRLSRLLATPSNARAQLEGQFKARFITLDPDTVPVITISGDVELAVEAQDHIDGSKRTLTPYRIRLDIDGKRWHETRYDRVSYGDKAEPELDYVAQLRAEKSGLFQRLTPVGPRARVHRRQGRRLGRLRPGDHPATLIAEDAAGNVSRQRLVLRVQAQRAPAEIQRVRRLPKRALQPTPVGVVWRANTVVIPLSKDTAAVSTRFGGRSVKTRLTWLDRQPAVAVDLPEGMSGTLEVRTKSSAGGGSRWRLGVLGLQNGESSGDGRAEIEVGEEALFVPYVTHITEGPNPGAPGLKVGSALYGFSNGWIPTRASSRLRLKVPRKLSEAHDHLGLYFNEGDRWWRMSGASGAWANARIVHPGAMAFMYDVQPPTVGAVELQSTPYGRRLLLPVWDISKLSELSVSLDGAPVHPERQRAMKRIILHPKGLAAGEHELQIVAVDRAENRIETTRSFVWPPAIRAASGTPDGRSN